MERLVSAIKNFFSKTFSPKISLDKRIAYAMVFCAMGGEFFGFIESYAIGLPPSSYLLPLFSFIFLLILTIWGLKTKRPRLFSFLAIAFSASICFPLMFLANAGLHGGMPYYFLVVIVCIALCLRGKTRIIFFITILIEYSALFVLYRVKPEFFIPMTHEEAFVDQLCSMLLASVVLFTFSYIVSRQNYHDRHKIEQLSRLYERQANTDELTGMFNRRYFNNFLKLAILTLGDTEKLHLAMFDIDDFKQVNDKYGHPFGDTVLKSFAKILQNSEGDGVTSCRYGGEEFLLLLPKKNRDDALKIVEEILEEVRTTIKLPDEKFVTVSAGFLTCKDGMTYETVLQNVDKNLYEAKCTGKNKIVSD